MSSHTLAKYPFDQFLSLILQIVSKDYKNIFWDFGSKLKSDYLLTFHLTSIVTSFIRSDKLKYRGLRDKETDFLIDT